MTEQNHLVETGRLALRPFTPSDAQALSDLMAPPEVRRYLPTTVPYTLERAEKYIAAQARHWQTYSCGWWAVERKAAPGLVGWGGLQYLPDTQEYEVGYVIGKPFWGQGYATELAAASLAFGFNRLGLMEIIGLTHPDNTVSQSVLRKSGLKYNGLFVYFGIQSKTYRISREEFFAGI